MENGQEHYQLQDSYFFVIDPFMCGIIGFLMFVVIILFFVWKSRKKKTIN
ncbi:MULTISPECIES: hypothetical protein [unclassified Lysinibacillus]